MTLTGQYSGFLLRSLCTVLFFLSRYFLPRIYSMRDGAAFLQIIFRPRERASLSACEFRSVLCSDLIVGGFS